MAGRALAFADTEIIRLANRDFVPVAADDWYQRRREDAEGKFFRSVADQGPRKGEQGSTRQGIYCFTADGQLLAYRNAQDPEVMRQTLRQGLRAWQQLPPQRRQPGAIAVADLPKGDARYTRSLPAGGLVINVWTRILDHTKDGYQKGTCSTRGGDQAARDHLWLTAAEGKSLLPANPRVGDRFAVPSAIAERLLRFHLIDNTRGEPPLWRHEDMRTHQLALTVREVTPEAVRLELAGHALLATNADVSRAERGFDVRLAGTLRYDRGKQSLARFNVVADGEHWGNGPFTRGARPGRQPLGVAFELAHGNSPADLVPPQGAREIDAYFGRTGR